MPSRPTKPLLLIYTGGTIGMVQDSSQDGLRPINFENIYQEIPLLQELDVELDYVSIKSIKDSSDFDIRDWKRIAHLVQMNYERCSGFVILHGTDTMAYTASALSFMFNNLDKPVIITGSQIPIRMLRSDGRDNLINAIEIASSQDENGSSIIKEVCICFNDKLYRGNRSVKDSSEFFNAFSSPNFPELATSGIDIIYKKELLLKPKQKPFDTFCDLNPNVVLIKLFPGMQAEIYESIFHSKMIKGVVLESYGTGNTPSADWFMNFVRAAYAQDMVVLNVSQCASGNVRSGLYEVSKELKAFGVVDGKQMTTESGLTKLMYLLGKFPDDIDKVRLKLQESLRGEV